MPASDHDPHLQRAFPAQGQCRLAPPAPGDPEHHPSRRQVVEVAYSWFTRFRRALIRWDKPAANYLGFVRLAARLIVYRKLYHAWLLSVSDVMV